MRPDWVGEGAAAPVVEDVAEAVGVDMESELMVIVGVAVVASGEQVSFKTVSYSFDGAVAYHQVRQRSIYIPAAIRSL
jgi:hypothetical protein